MPDENKFEKLREIRYLVPVTCGLCVHGGFVGSAKWGTCSFYRYRHKKHDNPSDDRGVSIHVAGSCPSAESDPSRTAELGAHAEFLGDKPF